MKTLPPGSTIGIFGSGQLGRMLAMAAARLGLKVHIYSDVSGPACEVAATVTIAPYENRTALRKFAQSVDIVTYEFENVPLEAATFAAELVPSSPTPKALEVAQDRLVEKTFISQLGIAVAPFAAVSKTEDFAPAIAATGLPARLKTRRLGYDGKGQVRIATKADLAKAFDELKGAPAILEGHIEFTTEISVLALRDCMGAFACYDVAENNHKNGILDTSTVPANVSQDVVADAQSIARRIGEALDYVGLLAVELFVVLEDNRHRLVVNEIAPRVHNSGHWTLDACQCCQFENHIRAVAGWPLGAASRHSNARMINLIGHDIDEWQAYAATPAASLHHYGKGDVRAGRKMGHVTQLSPLRPRNTRKT